VYRDNKRGVPRGISQREVDATSRSPLKQGLRRPNPPSDWALRYLEYAGAAQCDGKDFAGGITGTRNRADTAKG